MISALYVSLTTFFIVWLSLNVIKVRRKHQISLGDGGNEEMKAAIAAQSNAMQYFPLALILLLVLENNGGMLWMIHGFAVVFIAGRVFHARGLLTGNMKYRVLGMHITFYILVFLAVANLFFLPYRQLI